MNKTMLLSAVAGLALALSPVARAADVYTASITVENHRFSAGELRVPAGQQVELTIVNKDATPEEFESKVLKIEKVVAGKATIVVRFGPLKAGSYKFIGDYHPDTANGQIIAEDKP